MKLWVDDLRPAPKGYMWAKSVNQAIKLIQQREEWTKQYTNEPALTFELIDLDYDSGDFFKDGGDYIKILDWLEETGRNYPIHIHSQNVVGRMNMEAICQRNGWIIVY